VLNGLAVVAARLGIGALGAGLEEIAALVRNRLEADGDRCLVVFDNLADPDGVPSGPPVSGAKRRSGRAAPITDVITVPSHTKKDNPKAALKPHPHRQ
jgi:hypothetical protein